MEIKETRNEILKGLNLVSKRLIEEKTSKNEKIVISKRGKIVFVDPSEIVLT